MIVAQHGGVRLSTTSWLDGLAMGRNWLLAEGECHIVDARIWIQMNCPVDCKCAVIMVIPPAEMKWAWLQVLYRYLAFC